MDGQGTKCRRNIAENYNRLSRVHERFRQTDDRQTTDGGATANSERNVRSRSLKTYAHAVTSVVKVMFNVLVSELIAQEQIAVGASNLVEELTT